MTTPATSYPARLAIDYPDRRLDRLSTFLRLIYAIPILIVLGLVSGGTFEWQAGDATVSLVAAGGILVLAPLLMIVFRQKYPRWWFDWNLALSRFEYRVFTYLLLMDDQYPSSDEEQNVHLELDYPDVPQDLNRWLPLVKWLLAIPHYVVLVVLFLVSFLFALFAWFAILFTGRYPAGLFRFQEGFLRWGLRVQAYAFLLITDRYPPYALE